LNRKYYQTDLEDCRLVTFIYCTFCPKFSDEGLKNQPEQLELKEKKIMAATTRC